MLKYEIGVCCFYLGYDNTQYITTLHRGIKLLQDKKLDILRILILFICVQYRKFKLNKNRVFTMSLPDQQSPQRYHVLVHNHNRLEHMSCTHVARSRAHGMSIYPHQQMLLYHWKLMVVPHQRKRAVLGQQLWCGGKSSQLVLEIPFVSGESYHVQEGCLASVARHGVEVFVD